MPKESNRVESSNLKGVEYDASKEQLWVEFHSGSVYRYENVSESLYKRLLKAPSKGKFFWANIRQKPSLYPYRRIK